MKHICLITSGQPSANPRLVKEAMAFLENGYKVTVIYVPISPWADQFDVLLYKQYPQIDFLKTGYSPNQQRLYYKWARIRRKSNSLVYKYLGDTLNTVDFSTVLFGQELLKEAKVQRADLYVAHNLGALPAAVKAARHHNAKVGFDAEDFHRGEFAENSLKKKQTELIENKYFPLIDYLSVASPLIGKAYTQIFPALSPTVINNVFPISVLKELIPEKKLVGLNLFWFSQTIGKTRGLECVLDAIGLLRDLSIKLTLLGNVSVDMKEYILKVASKAGVNFNQIKFIAPVSEYKLFQIASRFDIGLASEVPYCLNREYCLTNKIFTYLIAGNAIVMSDTKAQTKFLEDNPKIGLLYKHNNPESLASVLRFYSDNRGLLLNHQKNARELAEKKLNWEIESKKLLSIVESVLQK